MTKSAENNLSTSRSIKNNQVILEQNIVLTGFMGSGKTTVGQILAGILKWNFIETDRLIEQSLGMPILKIFELHGEDFFRDKECEIVQTVKSLPPGTCVISTGGGVVLRPENIAALKATGMIFYLDLSAKEALLRLKDKKDRPLLQEGGLMNTISGLMNQRRHLYDSSADYKVNTEGKKPEEVAREIELIMKGNKNVKE